MKCLSKFLIINLLLLWTVSGIAQTKIIPLNHGVTNGVEKEMLKDDGKNHHTAIKPFNHFEVGHVLDSIQESYRFEKDIEKKFPRWLFNSVFNDHTFNFSDKENDKYSFIINPLADLRLGTSSDLDNIPFTNARGLQIMGHIGKNMTFYSDFYENQARFAGYVNQQVNEDLVVPGQGFPKKFDSVFSDEKSFDFAYATGNITYQPNEFFNFQFGHGKNFIGEGYRSLLLSDNAFNYPYLRIKTSFWKINYVNLFTQMQDIVGPTYNTASFDKKYVVSHYFSINATKNFNIGLYESVVYQDSTQTFDLNFLNPIILYRPIEFAVGSRKGNALLGMTMSYKIKKKMMIYGQIMLDEFKFEEVFKGDGWWANKYAFQLGFKSYDFITPGLNVRTELNYARPFTYTHRTTGRNYGHYNQPLAHPLGANFIESVNIATYQKGRWLGEVEMMFALQGRDSLGTNVGSDVFLPYDTRENDYGNETLQGIRSTTFYLDAKVGYLINPRTNLRAEFGMTYRTFTPELETTDLSSQNTTYIYFGITTALTNKYYDF